LKPEVFRSVYYCCSIRQRLSLAETRSPFRVSSPNQNARARMRSPDDPPVSVLGRASTVTVGSSSESSLLRGCDMDRSPGTWTRKSAARGSESGVEEQSGTRAGKYRSG
jgi:hypothetical protein